MACNYVLDKEIILLKYLKENIGSKKDSADQDSGVNKYSTANKSQLFLRILNQSRDPGEP